RLHEMLGATIIYVTHDQIEAMTLATRIAVMREGRIEQLAEPETIYRDPANLYVAGFVGSPAMNVFFGRLDAAGSRPAAVLDVDGSRIALDPERYRATSDAPVAVAVRPEAIRLAIPGEPASVTAQVEIIELTGPEKLVSATIGDVRFTARLDPNA